MGTHKEVDLLAALYDEEKRTPTYRFLHGIVGKSYAFETAERYGIPKNLVEEAKIVHGDDKEKLNELIEKSANIEQQLIEKREKLDLELENLELLKRDLQQEKDRFYHGLENKKGELQTIYSGAISEAKMSIKAKTIPDTHKHMTEAHKMLPKDEVIEDLRNYELKVGEKVKYNESIGTILQIRGKYAKVEINGMRVDLKLDRLQRALKIPTVRTKVEVKVEKPDRASLRLDLHGKRREEALEELDQFLSNALLQGWDEVFITHGVGTGVLAKAVTQFLREHPRVDWFGDAPPNMGGKGGKLVRF
jgi:DNA mismatch repair protein MutS2